MSQLISVSDRDQIRHIQFNRPHKKNAITREMYSCIAEALNAANEDDIRVIIISGNQGVFSAGNDMTDFINNPPHLSSGELQPVEQFMNAVMECKKPIIAAVDGVAIGIGTTLLLHCDFVYATARAKFSTPFVSLALAPEFGSSQILPGIVGRVVANELLILGETWDAKRAESKGLINAILPEKTFQDDVTAIARRLAELAPSAVQSAKALITQPMDDIIEHMQSEGKIFTAQLQTGEFREAAKAFMERRAPDFSQAS